MAKRPYEAKVMMAGAGESAVVLPVRQEEVRMAPNFFEFMEDEYNGDYSAARSAYMRKYRIDPSGSTQTKIR